MDPSDPDPVSDTMTPDPAPPPELLLNRHARRGKVAREKRTPPTLDRNRRVKLALTPWRS